MKKASRKARREHAEPAEKKAFKIRKNSKMKGVSYISIKYRLDRPLAALLLVLCAPFILIFAAVAAFELRALPFIVQERGLTLENGKLKIYKLRTMKRHSTNNLKNTKNLFEKHYLESFVPPFCRWLRQTGLDELPQLLNVIKGEMSLIGPRPFTLEDLNLMKRDDTGAYEVLGRLQCKPGITGCWQVHGSRKQGIANMVWLQEYYDINISFLLDIKIFLSTLPLIMLGQHTDTIVVKELVKSRKVMFKSFSHG